MSKIHKSFLLFCIVLLTSILCIGIGSVNISNKTVFHILINHILGEEYFTVSWKPTLEIIVWSLRVPRILLGFITGASLALVGIVMQTMTQNSLAEPYILGISSGASAGAVAVIILALEYPILQKISIEQGAFLGSLLSISIVFLVSSIEFLKGSHLILTGIGVSSFFSAVTMMIIYGSKNNSQLVTAMFWMTGSLSSASWENLHYPYFLFACFFCYVLYYSYEMDILLLGEEEAKILGMNTFWIKISMLLFSTFLVSVIVSMTGIIGFVGLVIPHISRKIIGYQHKQLFLFSSILGGGFLVVCDTFARSYFSPEEIPIGIMTAFIGTPLFLWIVHKNYTYGGKL